MRNEVKRFIEDYIDDIDDNDLASVFEAAYIELDNFEMDELVNTLELIGIDTKEAKEQTFYYQFCAAMSFFDWNQFGDEGCILPTFLEDYMNNRCGLTYEQIVAYIEANQINLNVNFAKNDDGIWCLYP